MFLERLTELMSENKTNRSIVSKATGIPETTFSGWYNAQTSPSLDKLTKLADYFEVSIDYLVGRSNDIGIIQTNANLSDFQNELLTAVARLPMDYQREVLGFALALER